MKKLTTVFIALAALAAAGFAQTIDKPTQARWHVAENLLSREWTPQQRAFLLRAATAPTKEMESEARALFTPKDFTDVFLKIGNPAAGDYKRVRDLDTLAGKKLLMRTLAQGRRAAVWRTHLAYILATRQLTPEQQGFLLEAAAWIGSPFAESGEELGRRSHELFGEDGREIFGTIGSYKSVGRLCDDAAAASSFDDGGFLLEGADCVCNVNGSNWSCYDTCYSSSTCTAVDGCGFMWMFRCNGTCRT